MNKIKNMNFSIGKVHEELLRKLKDQMGLTMSDLIRRAIDELYAKHYKEVKE